ncbi:TraR/DksA family transcriptional regulator [Duganella callida]|uniref:TraR/DksA family transcriptional regulator n=1 Tax=Duganella callida TaxID=2561932 RepID=A0A4Y9SJW0_9BURK|nr:TraR/DksA family transcriptional regulator [Duganella callida]TFW23129.1 TraR/DksA family transcriptional regulator [Duganella callida]
MTALSAAQLHTLAQRLQLQRAQLVARLRQRLHQADEEQQLALFNDYEIDADLAAASELGDTDLALLQHELAQLRSVDAALARMREHRYGVCAGCEAAIAPVRLLAQPDARLCHACQAERERRAIAGLS